jgi:hypothetical protein
MNNNIKLTVFLDTIGRTLVAEKVSEDDTNLVIKNPAVVNITPNPNNGQISLQLLPLFFREFLADITESTTWVYKKALITLSEQMVLDFKFIAQYMNIFAPPQPQEHPQPETKQEKVIKLFDE